MQFLSLKLDQLLNAGQFSNLSHSRIFPKSQELLREDCKRNVTAVGGPFRYFGEGPLLSTSSLALDIGRLDDELHDGYLFRHSSLQTLWSGTYRVPTALNEKALPNVRVAH